MNVTVHPGTLTGRVVIPASKSHTIRALLIAALADGRSTITGALDSEDTQACIRILRGLGTEIETVPSGGGLQADDLRPGSARSTGSLDIIVQGTGGRFREPDAPLDCANSGTTLYLALSVAALQPFSVTFTGDDQLQRRSAGPLLRALESMGATVTRADPTSGPVDCVPLTITGPIRGGALTIECPTSQYLSSLLLAAPLTERGMEITVPLLNERPYVDLTLSWLDRQGVAYERTEYERFVVGGGRAYETFSRRVPGDFSSATFFVAAAAATGSTLRLDGLDMNDSQGDRAVVAIAKELGCRVTIEPDSITVTGPSNRGGAGGRADGNGRGAEAIAPLAGGEFDLNAIPDALPALAVLGTLCREPLRLVNVPQARQKETDRIAVMAKVITSLGGKATELPDGLVVEPGRLRGGAADSAGDHRVAMALAVAGLAADGPVTVENAGVAAITFPGFYEMLASVGAEVDRS